MRGPQPANALVLGTTCTRLVNVARGSSVRSAAGFVVFSVSTGSVSSVISTRCHRHRYRYHIVETAKLLRLFADERHNCVVSCRQAAKGVPFIVPARSGRGQGTHRASCRARFQTARRPSARTAGRGGSSENRRAFRTKPRASRPFPRNTSRAANRTFALRAVVRISSRRVVTYRPPRNIATMVNRRSARRIA